MTILMRLLKLHLILFLTFTCHSSIAQDWKTLYDQSKRAYDASQFDEALANGEKALALAKNTDAKTTAHTLQLLTSICLQGLMQDKGLLFSREETKMFLELEGENSKHYYEAVQKQSKFFHQAGELQSAVEKNVLLDALAVKIYGAESREYYISRFNHAQLLMQLNLFAPSQALWNTCLEKLKQFPESREDYFYGLFYAAYVDYKMNAWQDAIHRWTAFISLADQNSLQTLDEYKDAKAFLSELKSKGLTIDSPAASDGKSIQQHLASALAYQNEKQWVAATQEYTLAEKNITPENLFSNTVFSCYLNYARLLYQQGKPEQANLKLNESKKVAQKLFQPGSSEYGYIHYLEAELKLAQGNYSDARQLYLSAFSELKSVTPEIQVIYLTNAGRMMLSVDQPQFALELMQPFVQSGGNPATDKHQFDLITTYCEVLEQLNQYDKASNYLNEKIAQCSPAIKVRLQIRLAEILKESGSWAEASNVLYVILKSTGLPEETKAEAAYQLARTQHQLAQYVDAEKNYLSALGFYNQVRSENGQQVSNSLATLYIQLGNFEAAEAIYRNALESMSGHTAFANTQKQNLAAVYQQTNKYEEAQKLLEEVVQSERESTAGSVSYAVSLQNLAALHQKQGHYERAKTLYTEALDIDRKYFGEHNLSYAAKMANLAAVYQETGDLDKARSLFEAALKIRETKLGTEHPDYVFNQYNLAVLYQRMQHYTLALPLYKKISAFYIQQIHEIFPAMSEQEKSAFYNKIEGVINAYQDFAIEHSAIDKTLISELLDFRLQTKALLLNSSTVIRNRILNSGDTDLTGKFASWLQTKEQLAYLFSLSTEERAARKSDVEALQQKANTLEKELSAKSELFASATEKRSAHWREIQAVLNPGEAAIEIIRSGLNFKNDSVIYVALIVKPGLQAPAMVIMPQGRNMENREFLYYRNTTQYLVLSERSYITYWKSLEPHLSDVTTIYFSPDGIYNKINVQTLYDHERKQYLVDRVSVKLVSNPKELLAKSGPASSNRHAVLVGFPDYLQDGAKKHTDLPLAGGTSAVLSLERGGIDALPGTKDEILKIEKLLRSNQWNVNSYLFEKATEEIVKAQHNPTLFHIATHGFFIRETTANLVNGVSTANTERNPLLRSGLMLAGAEKSRVNQLTGKTRKDNTDDGILTAYEAMNMNLQGTDLVVLSACETGAGEVRNGEGVYGLQRSFLIAGANSVMMSLWKVSDEATQELMALFYKHWLSLGDKRKAFHQSQLELRKNYPEPFYWGAFVMIGK
jgi:CHAT domain-containing protein/Tfp pilus assembly protein PilF